MLFYSSILEFKADYFFKQHIFSYHFEFVRLKTLSEKEIKIQILQIMLGKALNYIYESIGNIIWKRTISLILFFSNILFS